MVKKINDHNPKEILQSLSKRQSELIKAMTEYPIKLYVTNRDLNILIMSDPPQQLCEKPTKYKITYNLNVLYELEKIGLVYFDEANFTLTKLGQRIVAILSNKTIKPNQVKAAQKIINSLNAEQIKLIQSIREYPIKLNFIDNNYKILLLSDPPQKLIENPTKNIIIGTNNLLEQLEQIGLVAFYQAKFSLTDIGRIVAQNLHLQTSINKIKKQEELNRINRKYEYFELYKQGLTYQKIANKYGISRERVRQILNKNPEFHQYRKEQELLAKEAKLIAKQEKEEKAKKDL